MGARGSIELHWERDALAPQQPGSYFTLEANKTLTDELICLFACIEEQPRSALKQ
jgi:hypothetical protein